MANCRARHRNGFCESAAAVQFNWHVYTSTVHANSPGIFITTLGLSSSAEDWGSTAEGSGSSGGDSGMLDDMIPGTCYKQLYLQYNTTVSLNIFSVYVLIVIEMVLMLRYIVARNNAYQVYHTTKRKYTK